MDQWSTNIEADHSTRSQQTKVITDKPAGLGDGCYLSATNRIQQPLTDPATGRCAATRCGRTHGCKPASRRTRTLPKCRR